MMIKTRFTDLADIQWPIVQAPMIGGYSSPEMVAKVSSQGCLGTLALGNSSPENIEQQYTETKKMTNKPFAANFFVSHNTTIPNIEQKSMPIKALQPYYKELGIAPAFLNQKQLSLPQDLNAQIEAVIGLKIPIITFTFGIPSDEIVKKLKQNGTLIVATATSEPEARLIQSKGFDAVILQGIGAGGHRASFLTDGNSGPDTALLNQQTSASITIPKIVTGGIMNGQKIADYINTGADACQLGSAYLFTDEANLEDYYLAALQKIPMDTCLSKSFTGKYARVLRNKFTLEMKNKMILSFPFQGQLTAELRTKAAVIRDYGLLPFWAGDSAYLGQQQAVESLTKKLINDLYVSLFS
jgi:nitronate monooxygenase